MSFQTKRILTAPAYDTLCHYVRVTPAPKDADRAGQPAARAGGGRPAIIDPDAVAAIALQLFAERGYEQTSMADIARAAGIGRKSLYRYFAGKAELVWGGIGPVVDASGKALDHAPGRRSADTDPMDDLRAAAVAGVAAIPDLSVSRGRLRLIAEHPDLAGRSSEALAPQRARVHAFLLNSGVSEAAAGYLSAAFLAATFEAWLRWAAGHDPDPAAHLTAAVGVLRLPAV